MPRLVRRDEVVIEERWLPQPVMVEVVEPEPEPDWEAMAEEIRAQAREEAEAMRAAARAEAERLKAQAYADGEAAGRQLAEHAYDEKIAEMETLIAEMNEEREAFFTRVEPELIRLAVVCAEKVLQQQLTMKPEVVVDITRGVMKRIREREVLRIRVNPDDLPLLSEARAALMNEVDGVREILFYDDRRVSRGGVVIDAENGALDARLNTQMDVIRETLEDAIGGAGESPTD